MKEWWMVSKILAFCDPKATPGREYDLRRICQSALVTIYAILLGAHKYAPRRDDYHTVYLDQHPFDASSNEKIIIFVGSLGVSSSIGLFIKHVTAKLLAGLLLEQDPINITVYGIPEGMERENEIIPLGHFVIAEVANSYESFLVGGMTTYSGEGSSAWAELWAVLYHWAFIFGSPIRYELVSKEAFNKLEKEIYERELEQEAESGK